jgi:chemotaxis protein CheX
MEIPSVLLTNLVSATQDVFETMVFRSVQTLPPLVQEPVFTSHVVGTVAFAGSRSGAVSLHSSTEVAREITGAMLGIPAASVNGEMPDAIGEVVNMIAGTLRTRMAAIEPGWSIAIPTVVVGSDFSTQYVHYTARAMCPFSLGEEQIYVELILMST